MISKSALIIVWHLGWLLVAAGQSPVVAGENAYRRPANEAELQLRDKSTEDTNAQWFADPERGWIRVEPRQQPKKKAPAQPAQHRIENAGGKATISYRDY